MSLQRIKDINDRFISLFAVLDGWCDDAPESDDARGAGLRTFLLETTCVFESVRLKVPAITITATADAGVCVSVGPPCAHSRPSCLAGRGGLRNELREQLYAGLCLLETLGKIHRQLKPQEYNDSLWILEEILEKGSSFINLWSLRHSSGSQHVASNVCD